MKIFQGIDIVSVRRIQNTIEKQGASFLKRVFTPAERRYCESKRMKHEHYAARFAAKEAVIKTLNDFRKSKLDLIEVEVKRQATGRPLIQISKKTAARLKLPAGYRFEVSLSHERDFAIATVLLILPA